MVAGKGDLDTMFDEAVRKANDIMAHGPAGDLRTAARRTGNTNGRQANPGRQ
jgi:hypothetical protein